MRQTRLTILVLHSLQKHPEGSYTYQIAKELSEGEDSVHGVIVRLLQEGYVDQVGLQVSPAGPARMIYTLRDRDLAQQEITAFTSDLITKIHRQNNTTNRMISDLHRLTVK